MDGPISTAKISDRFIPAHDSRLRRTPAGVEQTSAGPADPNDAFDAALALEDQGDLIAAEERYGAADRLGHAGAASGWACSGRSAMIWPAPAGLPARR